MVDLTMARLSNRMVPNTLQLSVPFHIPDWQRRNNRIYLEAIPKSAFRLSKHHRRQQGRGGVSKAWNKVFDDAVTSRCFSTVYKLRLSLEIVFLVIKHDIIFSNRI